MKKLVAYITAGLPSSSFTVDLALHLSEAGVDLLELGVPFSDPVADGPIIEQANLHVLKRGFKMHELFDITQKITPKIDTLWMGYFNSFYRNGFEAFAQKAKDFGVSGFIIPDLPFEESSAYAQAMASKNLSMISFVAPTDSKSRIEQVAVASEKFVYLVAYAGITGSGVSEDLGSTIESIRSVTKTPIYIGFGVDEHTARDKARGVDGVIVGSAFIKILLDDSMSESEKIKKISALATLIKEQINS